MTITDYNYNYFLEGKNDKNKRFIKAFPDV